MDVDFIWKAKKRWNFQAKPKSGSKRTFTSIERGNKRKHIQFDNPHRKSVFIKGSAEASQTLLFEEINYSKNDPYEVFSYIKV